MRTCIPLAIAAALALSAPAAVACTDHAHGAEAKAQPAAKITPFVPGEVREVDLEERTITLSHGSIPSLRMQPMGSMAFKAHESAVIAGLKPGDKVRFRATLVGEQPTIVRIEPARR